MNDLEFLRDMIDEETEDNYTDVKLQMYIDKYTIVELAAAHVWRHKAVKIKKLLEPMKHKKYSLGSDTFEYRDLTEEYKLCMTTADLYQKMGDEKYGMSVNATSPMAISFVRPDVLDGYKG